MNFCTKCGAPVKESANFCVKCGCDLNHPTVAVRSPKKSHLKTFIACIGLLAMLCVLGYAAYFAIEKSVVKKEDVREEVACEVCDEIEALRAELQTASGKSAEAISNDIKVLLQHDCSKPIQQVENQKYTYDGFSGYYSGGWRTGTPCGTGDYIGSCGNDWFIYNGEWYGGEPYGEGYMFTFVSNGLDKWRKEEFVGTFEEGKLCGQGRSNYEDSNGSRYEYFDGTYFEGYLRGEAYFVQYKNGEIFDEGIVEGSHCTVTYSKRAEIQEILDKIQVVATVAIATVSLYELWKWVGKHSGTSANFNSVSDRFGEDGSASADIAEREEQRKQDIEKYENAAEFNERKRDQCEPGSADYQLYDWRANHYRSLANGNYVPLISGGAYIPSEGY